MEQLVLQKWEYHVEEMHNTDALQTTLTRLGNEGWELVSVAGGASGDVSGPVKTLRRKQEAFRAFFKRPA